MPCIHLVIAKLTRGEKSIDQRERGGARERGGVYMNQRDRGRARWEEIHVHGCVSHAELGMDVDIAEEELR